MLTMLLGGLWHGAAWTFVVWGGIHGAALAAERWWRGRAGYVERTPDAWGRAWRRLATFHVVCVGWIFFRAESFSAAWDMISAFLTNWGQSAQLVSAGVVLAILAGIGSQYLPARFPVAVMARFSRLSVVGQAVVLAFSLMAIQSMGPAGVAPLIYFQF
jgi:D-alanyl-lipoteichoic acid acyltransferase DltB (MBOAT superfamily)